MRVARLLLAGVFVALVVFAPFPGNTRLFRALHDSAHAPIFGCIALLALAALRSHRRFGAWRPAAQYAAALAIAALLGVVTELLQIPAGRDASFFDVRNDVLGAVAFLAAFAAFAGGPARLASKPVLLLTVVATLTAAMFPAIRSAVELARREAQFPVIADFDRRMDRYYAAEQWAKFERTPLPSPWGASKGEQALHVAFQSGPWPGVDFYELSSDWSGYSTLLVDLTNPTDSTLELVLRVHDRLHTRQFDDRFNERYDVPPRTRAVLRVPLAEIRAAPKGRQMGMHEMAGLILFRTQASKAQEMYLSRLWLE
jgi:hypothetical protein